MSDPFIGEMRMIAWNYPPRYWAFCDGATLAINTNQALFALLGTTYGGDGVRTFQLPDLRSRALMGWTTQGAQPNVVAQTGGEESHVVLIGEYPLHMHNFLGTATAGTLSQPAAANYVASYEQAFAAYPTDNAQITSLEPSDISTTGNGAGHENRQPWLCVPFIIALSGIFPSRN